MEKRHFIDISVPGGRGGHRVDTEVGSGSLDSASQKRIFKTVAAVHAAFVLICLGWFAVADLLKKPTMETVRVTLVSPSALPSAASAAAAPAPKPRRPRPRPQQRPRPRPVSKPRHATSAPQKPKTPPKKKWTPRKTITISHKTVVKNPAPQKPMRPTAPAPPVVTASQLERELRKGCVRTTPAASTPAKSLPPSGYYDKVSAALYALWRQPSKAELGGKLPTVDLTITIDASGAVKVARVSRRSGNGTMDASALALTHRLRVLPKPPNGGMTLTVTLEVVE